MGELWRNVRAHKFHIPNFGGWLDWHQGMEVRSLKVGFPGEWVEVTLWQTLGSNEVKEALLHNMAHESLSQAREKARRNPLVNVKYFQGRIKETDDNLREDIQGHKDKT